MRTNNTMTSFYDIIRQTLLRYVRLIAWAARLSVCLSVCRLLPLVHSTQRFELFSIIFAPSNSF